MDRTLGWPPPSLLTCIDERDQADAVCRSILDHRERGTRLREQAVLFRAGHHSDVLEVELTRRNIPFVKYGGLKFLESAHVKDALAVLRIADNPRDEVSWFRVLQLLDHVGPAGARRVMAAIGVSALGDPMTRFLGQAIAVPAPRVRSSRASARHSGTSPSRTPRRRSGRTRPPVPRAPAPPALRPARAPPARPRAARAARDRVREPGAVRHRAHARPPVSTSDLAGPRTRTRTT